MNLKVRKLADDEIIDIYLENAPKHFPDDELKPDGIIKKLLENGCYMGTGMFDENECLAGYALFTTARTEYGPAVLLDYYAVLEEYRQKGAGSLFLKKIAEQFRDIRGILIETEDIDFAANEEETAIRRRRDSFYIRNGAVPTGIKSFVEGVRYNIWYLETGCAFDRDYAKAGLEGLYKIMFEGWDLNYEYGIFEEASVAGGGQGRVSDK